MNTLIGNYSANSSEQGAQGSVAAVAPCSAGASPSNTAPAICMESEVTVLLTGVDSLYVSYQGTLSSDWDIRLAACKLSAQSEDPGEQLQAQVEIGGHLFLVHDRGSGRFAYVLSDNWFRIAVARSSAKSIPVMHIQISSESLLLEGAERVFESLTAVINTVAYRRSGPHVSRSDIRVDFVTSVDLARIEVDAWVTRARDRAKRFVGRNFSGWSIGLGGNVSGRLYNKLLELDKSRKFYMRDIWTARGWDGVTPVMRLEFQLERAALGELGVDTVPDLFARLPALWRYCTGDWLQLKVPNLADDTPTRWPIDPFWVAMAKAWDDSSDTLCADRARKERIPADDRLFLQGFGGVTSFMASRGIVDPATGFARYIEEARAFHRNRDTSFAGYVQAKVLDKGRRYSTIRTRIDAAGDSELTQERTGPGAVSKGPDGE